MTSPSTTIQIPELSLVVLIGPSGAGKSTFARKHFRGTEIISSDFCRALVSDDENSQAASKDAFEVLHTIVAKRLANARLTVVDATNVRPEHRASLVALARQFHCFPVAVVLDLPERVCRERDSKRTDRQVGGNVIAAQRRDLRQSFRGLAREGFRHLFVLHSVEEVDAATIERQPLYNDRRGERGPFDIVGDVHGCFDELRTLLEKLGYAIEVDGDADRRYRVTHPDGRRVVFLGDLCDRGPNTPEVLRLAMDMTTAGTAICVPGNHDVKLMRKLRGRDVRITHGLAESLRQLGNEPPDFSVRVADFIDKLVSHYVLDGGRLVVAHAGMKQSMQGRGSGKVREFALYGETTGETDEFGLPVRYPWADEYRGEALVVYGHTPVPDPAWVNNTVNVDTGCVFGGRLTALRYPERETVYVRAACTYYESPKPFLPEEQQAAATESEHRDDDVLDLADVLGGRSVNTRLQRAVLLRPQNAAAALEVMSRFAVDPRWLIYLPPTMSPCETSLRPDLLEHPVEAFSYYRSQGLPTAVCEEKHMGSRAVFVLCRDAEAARLRFGTAGAESGICYTRTGRRFFNDPAVERELVARLADAVGRAGWWERLKTDWVCLDAELLPWSAKAQELLRQQYAAVAASGRSSLHEAVRNLTNACANGPPAQWLLERFRSRSAVLDAYREAYGRYCWQVDSVDDLAVAPFHVLATEGRVHCDRDHEWHMTMAHELCAAEASGSSSTSILRATEYRRVDLTDPASEAEAVRWWEELTGRGGEGMVVKPLDFVAQGPQGLVQPAVKVRGREYLRIIYGPEYTAAGNLARLRARGLGAKRALARREFALGVEALERFVRREPLHRVHECVFAVLALESEAVDPRL